VELPGEFAETLGPDAGRETLVAAVLRWFEEGRISQGQAAELLGMSRGQFFDLLYAHRVSPVQMSIEDLEEDFSRG
jgi:predicted HTH domain antitoxin